MSFKLPDLDYSHDALEPHIDTKTMEIHHGKHHAGYTSKLNAAVQQTEASHQSIEDIMKSLDMSDSALRNNGGGYYNHCLFWKVMSPSGGGNPPSDLADAIERDFGSFEDFKTEFSNAAATQFGSGWAWLCVHSGGKLEVCSTPNQDNPMMPGVGCGGTPILGLDVWEHAYYLNYQNRRPDYIEAFFNVINWDDVSNRYNTAK
tara:strand:+ start:31 stop:639 length:609 start_codon:yes stop_codon:yes gene_type:complete